MLDDFIHWLGATPVSQLIQKVFWIIPTVQAVHILAISVVLSSMAMFDLRLLGLAGKRNSVASLSRRFMPWLWGALIVLAASGCILIIGEPKRSLGNVVFQLKMCMLAAPPIWRRRTPPSRKSPGCYRSSCGWVSRSPGD